jgi:hypothetical protein
MLLCGKQVLSAGVAKDTAFLGRATAGCCRTQEDFGAPEILYLPDFGMYPSTIFKRKRQEYFDGKSAKIFTSGNLLRKRSLNS